MSNQTRKGTREPLNTPESRGLDRESGLASEDIWSEGETGSIGTGAAGTLTGAAGSQQAPAGGYSAGQSSSGMSSGTQTGFGDQSSSGTGSGSQTGFSDQSSSGTGSGSQTGFSDQSSSGIGSGSQTGFSDQSSSGTQSETQTQSGGLTDKVNSTMGKAAEGLDRISGTVREKTEEMGENQLTSMAKGTADRIESGAQALRSMDTDEMITNVESMIRQKPVESLLVAAAVGYVLARAI